MKLIKLHSKTPSITYKNSLCSIAFFLVFCSALASVMIPVLLVSFLSPYSGISECRVLFEQPNVKFQFKYLFLAEENNEELVACSTFPYFNKITDDYQRCQGTKFWQEDFNYDKQMDRANFEIKIDSEDRMDLRSFHFILFFEAELKHKCHLKPPAVLIQQHKIPEKILPSGIMTINSRLKLVQNSQFLCPFYGRSTKSHFNNEILNTNATDADLFDLQYLKDMIRMNPGYFEAETTDIFYLKRSQGGLTIRYALDIMEIDARYHMSIWERLGQFWLYFASFFGISFFVVDKIKDYLFSKHVIRSWENIPWKKIY